MKGFMTKPIPTLTGDIAREFIEMAERNSKLRKKNSRSVDIIKKVMEKQERYLRSQC